MGAIQFTVSIARALACVNLGALALTPNPSPAAAGEGCHRSGGVRASMAQQSRLKPRHRIMRVNIKTHEIAHLFCYQSKQS